MKCVERRLKHESEDVGRIEAENGASRAIRRVLCIILALLFFAGTFFVLDLQSVPTGDDLGYMFADSAHHLGDGKRVETISQITSTQASHYIHCNGRFIVHWLTMFFLNIAGHKAFCLVNSLFFFCALILFSKLCNGDRRVSLWSLPVYAIILWACVPQPGMTWLSLVSYATNYLWSTVVNFGFLLFIIGERKKSDENRGNDIVRETGACIMSFIIGTFQESFSLPISAALFIYLITRKFKNIGRGRLFAIAGYWAGTVVCFFAPGNLSHADQGGGFAADAIINKSTALIRAIPDYCPVIVVGCVIMIISLIFNWKGCREFIRQNSMLFWTSVFAMLLAFVSFTSVRQLTCPSILVGVMLVKVLTGLCNNICRNISCTRVQRRITGLGCTAIYIMIFVGALLVRSETSQALKSVHQQAAGHNSVIIYPAELKHDRVIDRALDINRLPVLFDGYTKRGLSRVYNGAENSDKITTILPAGTDVIVPIAKSAMIEKSTIKPVLFKRGVRCVFIPKDKTIRHIHDTKGNPAQFERVVTEEGTLLLVPDRKIYEVLTYN